MENVILLYAIIDRFAENANAPMSIQNIYLFSPSVGQSYSERKKYVFLIKGFVFFY